MTISNPNDLFDTFSAEVRHLHVTWVLWRRLFSRAPEAEGNPEEAVRAGKEAYRVTREASELLFRYVRWHMLRGVILDLCRLCDPRVSMGKANLTLERVFDETDFSGQPTLKMMTENAMREAIRIARASDGVGGFRNKLLAHFDLDTALGVTSPADFEINEVELAVRWVVAFQCRVAWCREGRPFDIQAPHPHVPQSVVDGWKGDADNLVRVLAAGLVHMRP